MAQWRRSDPPAWILAVIEGEVLNVTIDRAEQQLAIIMLGLTAP